MLAKNSIFDFAFKKFIYHQKCRFNPSLTEHKEILLQLRKDGIVILKNYFDQSQIDALMEEIESAKKSPKKKDIEKEGIYQEPSFYRIFNIRELAPSTNLFFENPLVQSVFKAYFSKTTSMFKGFYESKAKIGLKSMTNFHHIDDWKHRMKAYLLLRDVSRENGPMVYVKGSHKWGLWKFWREYTLFLYSGYDNIITSQNYDSGSFFPTEIEILKKWYHFEEIFCVGKAGTLILVDAMGLHRSTVLQKSERQLLAGYWNFDGTGY